MKKILLLMFCIVFVSSLSFAVVELDNDSDGLIDADLIASGSTNDGIVTFNEGGTDDDLQVTSATIDEDGNLYLPGTMSSAPQDDPYMSLDTTTAGDSDWYIGQDADQNATGDDRLEFRNTAAGGSQVEMWLEENTDGAQGLHITGDLWVLGNDLFIGDSGVINLGDDNDVPLTHVPDTGIQMELDDSIMFGDTAVFIESDDDGYLDLDADGDIRLNTTTTTSGLGTFLAGIMISDGQTIKLDESGGDPNDCDVSLSAADGVFTIEGSNGVNNENIKVDVDQTSDEVGVSSSTGVTNLNFGTLNMATTGTIMGAVKINSDADGMSQGEMTAAGVYGTMYFATGAGTWNLPAAAAGMCICIYSTTAAAIIVNPDDADTITYDGVKDTAGHQIASPSAAGDFITLIALDATDWYVLGHSGTWVPGS